MTEDNSIVVTGLGVVSPIGMGRAGFWHGLETGKTGITPVSLFDVSEFGSRMAGEITAFDPELFLEKKGLKYFNRTTKLLMSATFLSLQDAGIKNQDREYLCYGPDQVGVVLGTTCGVISSIGTFDRETLTAGPQFVSPMAFANTVLNAPAGHLAIKEDIRGLNVTVSNGYTASLDAVSIGLNHLRNKRVSCIITGGGEELCEELFLFFKEELAASEDSFLGEGSVIMTLEHMKNATERQAPIYGEIAGYGNTLSQDIQGMAEAIELALEEADSGAEKIDWIITGTNVNLQQKNIEASAIDKIFPSTICKTDLRPQLGDSYSAGGSMQIGAGLRLINQNLANNILITSIDSAGNNSALIIRGT
jgi:3-oxoacyl-[acyl-carrier-protein] synthase II